MTLARAVELQTAVMGALTGAMGAVPVNPMPGADPDRFLRVDGYTILDTPIWRNREQATHAFFVHAFDSPPHGTLSMLWSLNALMQADAAIREMLLPGGTRPRMEDVQSSFEPRADGLQDAHAFARYSVTLGEL